MNQKRPYYPTKAAWAAAKAEELRTLAANRPYVPSSNWRAVQRRAAGQDNLYREAARFARLAEHYRARGL
jgi:hypothetical protein